MLIFIFIILTYRTRVINIAFCFLFYFIWYITNLGNCSFTYSSSITTAIAVPHTFNPSPLISGRKFDLRIYVLVTSFHPLRVWLAREGFARLCGRPFDLKNIEDSRVHLTNTAIQLKAVQNAQDFPSIGGEEIKRDCKWALSKLKEYLITYHGAQTVENLMQRIAGISMISTLHGC